MISIENEQFRAAIDEHGAQLTHLINKTDHFDYIWNGSQWPKHAPVLFPAIGRSNKDQYKLNGKVYDMPQHGFAGDQDFTVVYQATNAVALELAANDETKSLYPFDFKLTVTFTLLSTGLSVSFNVQNLTDSQMPYSLGSHPAFNVPINDEGQFEDYQVEFLGVDEPLKTFEIVKTPAPYRTGKVEPLKNSQGNVLKLNYETFKPGLRIIANRGIKAVRLFSPVSDHQVKLDVTQFQTVCLWTKEDENDQFLCLEPFNGLPDVLGDLVDWQHKPGNLILAPHANRVSQYEMHLS